MKAERTGAEVTTFGELICGDRFTCNGWPYIRILTTYGAQGATFNAVGLDDGLPSYFEEDEEVTRMRNKFEEDEDEA